LTLLEGIDQRLLVFWRRVPSDDHLDGYSVTQLCARAAASIVSVCAAANRGNVKIATTTLNNLSAVVN
jgi:hypothetical protein